MPRMFHRTLSATAFRPHGARRRIDPHSIHKREIDHQAIVTTAEPRSIMPAATDGCEQLLLAAEAHRGDHVSHIRATRDEQRSFVDHRVVKLARLLILSVASLN